MSASDGNQTAHGFGVSAAPLGQVVQSGQEHTGRWTREEHEAFLSALQEYGKEWKKVAAKVKTRTVVQTRTHAQKYFQKLQKGMATGEKIGIGGIEISGGGVKNKSPGDGMNRKKPQASRQSKSQGNFLMTPQERQAAEAAQAAAKLMTQISQVKPRREDPPPSDTFFSAQQPSSDLSMTMPASTSTPQYNPTQTFSQVNFVQHVQHPITSTNGNLHQQRVMTFEAPLVQHKIGTGLQNIHSTGTHTHFDSALLNQNQSKKADPPQAQAISSGITFSTALPMSGVQEVPPMNAVFQKASLEQQPTMKIVPPKLNEKMKFPEPSPAACGKRKLMEIAAAQIMAGVAASGVAKKGVKKVDENFSRKETPPPMAGVENESSPLKSNSMSSTFGGLQIVNPEVFGSSLTERRKQGGLSPTTPWDGEMEVLESEVRKKESERQQETLLTESENGCNEEGDQEMPYQSLPLSSISSTSNRSALHLAVCSGSIEDTSHILQNADIDKNEVRNLLSTKDYLGFTPLHSAVSIPSVALSKNLTKLLLSAGAEINSMDALNNTPLHWAARAGNSDVAQMLVMKGCPVDAQNHIGESALHWAMRAGSTGVHTVQMLLENGARASSCNKDYKRPIDVSANGFYDVDSTYLSSDIMGDSENLKSDRKRIDFLRENRSLRKSKDEVRITRENFLRRSPQARTLVLHHQECLDHTPKSDSDWEVPDRISAIMDTLHSDGNPARVQVRDYEIQVSSDFDRASLELLSRVHSAEYLTFVNDLSKELERRKNEKMEEESQSTVIPFTPMVQRTMMKESAIKKGSHSDTSFSSGSLRAARRAAGAVQHAVDCVLVGRNRNAFCVVRPPGHHAGVNGLLAGGESCGFCIFNNVAAAAMHALSDENQRPKCKRVAIVDIDAHHGNGTEEIVKRCHDPGRLFFFSVHLYDNDKRNTKANAFKFYPGTGDEDDVANNIINVPIAPLWRGKEILQKISVGDQSTPALGTRHSTRRKKREEAAAAAATSRQDDQNKDSVLVNSDVKSLDTSNTSSSKSHQETPPHYFMGTGREAYRLAIQQRLLPALRAFNPDLILVSLGLDASRGDVGNARHYSGGKEAEGINLEPTDYAWTTRRIMEIADICCQGRVISILEGGYGRTPKREKVDEKNKDLDVLDKTIFSECAARHLQALVDPYDLEKR